MTRPDILPSETTRVPVPLGDRLGRMYVTVTRLPTGPYEVFCQVGKGGEIENELAQAVGRLISLALRWEVPVEQIVKQLTGIGSGAVMWRGKIVRSIPDGVAQVLGDLGKES